ncbi:hypothetical protein GUITHDRAFT_139506 [Guillardia theta CCMP2712]|uniref:Uncharacterized protein n=1 Tax=Guillardia theta (strain CCMP2712) TaxID=905079 RepID=L1J9C5_GUITC|nr:hypothetical protein GUITHDRAFT_139506 [Guillardia theta CCMP2712]EKX44912.1 hypothetical protein GUITHDRAFT_139506 [Guillardia theta CCMP2712]|eukprot:XP_005831892.1 hypothetical protein GUITHDRAFT_139506 [Guillardia theta CCMP2712]
MYHISTMMFFSSRHKLSSHDSLLLLFLLSSVFPSAPYVTLSREGYSIEEEFLAQAGVRIEKNFEIYGLAVSTPVGSLRCNPSRKGAIRWGTPPVSGQQPAFEACDGVNDWRPLIFCDLGCNLNLDSVPCGIPVLNRCDRSCHQTGQGLNVRQCILNVATTQCNHPVMDQCGNPCGMSGQMSCQRSQDATTVGAMTIKSLEGATSMRTSYRFSVGALSDSLDTAESDPALQIAHLYDDATQNGTEHFVRIRYLNETGTEGVDITAPDTNISHLVQISMQSELTGGYVQVGHGGDGTPFSNLSQATHIFIDGIVGNSHVGWMPREQGSHTQDDDAELMYIQQKSDSFDAYYNAAKQYLNEQNVAQTQREGIFESSNGPTGVQVNERLFVGGEYSTQPHQVVWNGFRLVEQHSESEWGYRECPFLFNAGRPRDLDTQTNLTKHSVGNFVRVCLDSPTRNHEISLPNAIPDPLTSPSRQVAYGTHFETLLPDRQGNQAWSRSKSFQNVSWQPTLSGVIITSGNLQDLASLPGLKSESAFIYKSSLNFTMPLGFFFTPARVTCCRDNNGTLTCSFNCSEYRHQWSAASGTSMPLLKDSVNVPSWWNGPLLRLDGSMASSLVPQNLSGYTNNNLELEVGAQVIIDPSVGFPQYSNKTGIVTSIIFANNRIITVMLENETLVLNQKDVHVLKNASNLFSYIVGSNVLVNGVPSDCTIFNFSSNFFDYFRIYYDVSGWEDMVLRQADLIEMLYVRRELPTIVDLTGIGYVTLIETYSSDSINLSAPLTSQMQEAVDSAERVRKAIGWRRFYQNTSMGTLKLLTGAKTSNASGFYHMTEMQMHGRPVFRQQNGPNFLYYNKEAYSSVLYWAVGSSMNSYNINLKTISDALVPNDIDTAWEEWSEDFPVGYNLNHDIIIQDVPSNVTQTEFALLWMNMMGVHVDQRELLATANDFENRFQLGPVTDAERCFRCCCKNGADVCNVVPSLALPSDTDPSKACDYTDTYNTQSGSYICYNKTLLSKRNASMRIVFDTPQADRYLQYPAASGKVITTGNLEDITAIGIQGAPLLGYSRLNRGTKETVVHLKFGKNHPSLWPPSHDVCLSIGCSADNNVNVNTPEMLLGCHCSPDIQALNGSLWDSPQVRADLSPRKGTPTPPKLRNSLRVPVQDGILLTTGNLEDVLLEYGQATGLQVNSNLQVYGWLQFGSGSHAGECNWTDCNDKDHLLNSGFQLRSNDFLLGWNTSLKSQCSNLITEPLQSLQNLNLTSLDSKCYKSDFGTFCLNLTVSNLSQCFRSCKDQSCSLIWASRFNLVSLSSGGFLIPSYSTSQALPPSDGSLHFNRWKMFRTGCSVSDSRDSHLNGTLLPGCLAFFQSYGQRNYLAGGPDLIPLILEMYQKQLDALQILIDVNCNANLTTADCSNYTNQSLEVRSLANLNTFAYGSPNVYDVNPHLWSIAKSESASVNGFSLQHQGVCAELHENETKTLSCGVGGEITEFSYARMGNTGGLCGEYTAHPCDVDLAPWLAGTRKTTDGNFISCIGKTSCSISARRALYSLDSNLWKTCPSKTLWMNVQVKCRQKPFLAFSDNQLYVVNQTQSRILAQQVFDFGFDTDLECSRVRSSPYRVNFQMCGANYSRDTDSYIFASHKSDLTFLLSSGTDGNKTILQFEALAKSDSKQSENNVLFPSTNGIIITTGNLQDITAESGPLHSLSVSQLSYFRRGLTVGYLEPSTSYSSLLDENVQDSWWSQGTSLGKSEGGSKWLWNNGPWFTMFDTRTGPGESSLPRGMLFNTSDSDSRVSFLTRAGSVAQIEFPMVWGTQSYNISHTYSNITGRSYSLHPCDGSMPFACNSTIITTGNIRDVKNFTGQVVNVSSETRLFGEVLVGGGLNMAPFANVYRPPPGVYGQADGSKWSTYNSQWEAATVTSLDCSSGGLCGMKPVLLQGSVPDSLTYRNVPDMFRPGLPLTWSDHSNSICYLPGSVISNTMSVQFDPSYPNVIRRKGTVREASVKIVRMQALSLLVCKQACEREPECGILTYRVTDVNGSVSCILAYSPADACRLQGKPSSLDSSLLLYLRNYSISFGIGNISSNVSQLMPGKRSGTVITSGNLVDVQGFPGIQNVAPNGDIMIHHQSAYECLTLDGSLSRCLEDSGLNRCMKKHFANYPPSNCDFSNFNWASGSSLWTALGFTVSGYTCRAQFSNVGTFIQGLDYLMDPFKASNYTFTVDTKCSVTSCIGCRLYVQEGGLPDYYLPNTQTLAHVPPADVMNRRITFPDATGTVITSGNIDDIVFRKMRLRNLYLDGMIYMGIKDTLTPAQLQTKSSVKIRLSDKFRFVGSMNMLAGSNFRDSTKNDGTTGLMPAYQSPYELPIKPSGQITGIIDYEIQRISMCVIIDRVSNKQTRGGNQSLWMQNVLISDCPTGVSCPSSNQECVSSYVCLTGPYMGQPCDVDARCCPADQIMKCEHRREQPSGIHLQLYNTKCVAACDFELFQPQDEWVNIKDLVGQDKQGLITTTIGYETITNNNTILFPDCSGTIITTGNLLQLPKMALPSGSLYAGGHVGFGGDLQLGDPNDFVSKIHMHAYLDGDAGMVLRTSGGCESVIIEGAVFFPELMGQFDLHSTFSRKPVYKHREKPVYIFYQANILDSSYKLDTKDNPSEGRWYIGYRIGFNESAKMDRPIKLRMRHMTWSPVDADLLFPGPQISGEDPGIWEEWEQKDYGKWTLSPTVQGRCAIRKRTQDHLRISPARTYSKDAAIRYYLNDPAGAKDLPINVLQEKNNVDAPTVLEYRDPLNGTETLSISKCNELVMQAGFAPVFQCSQLQMCDMQGDGRPWGLQTWGNYLEDRQLLRPTLLQATPAWGVLRKMRKCKVPGQWRLQGGAQLNLGSSDGWLQGLDLHLTDFQPLPSTDAFEGRWFQRGFNGTFHASFGPTCDLTMRLNPPKGISNYSVLAVFPYEQCSVRGGSQIVCPSGSFSLPAASSTVILWKYLNHSSLNSSYLLNTIKGAPVSEVADVSNPICTDFIPGNPVPSGLVLSRSISNCSVVESNMHIRFLQDPSIDEFVSAMFNPLDVNGSMSATAASQAWSRFMEIQVNESSKWVEESFCFMGLELPAPTSISHIRVLPRVNFAAALEGSKVLGLSMSNGTMQANLTELAVISDANLVGWTEVANLEVVDQPFHAVLVLGSSPLACSSFDKIEFHTGRISTTFDLNKNGVDSFFVDDKLVRQPHNNESAMISKCAALGWLPVTQWNDVNEISLISRNGKVISTGNLKDVSYQTGQASSVKVTDGMEVSGDLVLGEAGEVSVVDLLGDITSSPLKFLPETSATSRVFHQLEVRQSVLSSDHLLRLPRSSGALMTSDSPTINVDDPRGVVLGQVTLEGSASIMSSSLQVGSLPEGPELLYGMFDSPGPAAANKSWVTLVSDISGDYPVTLGARGVGSFATTLGVVNPVEDNTLTLPDAHGTVLSSGSLPPFYSQVFSSEPLVFEHASFTRDANSSMAFVNFGDDENAVNVEFNAILSAQSIAFTGDKMDEFNLIFDVSDSSSDNILTLPDTSGTILTTGNLPETVTFLKVLGDLKLHNDANLQGERILFGDSELGDDPQFALFQNVQLTGRFPLVFSGSDDQVGQSSLAGRPSTAFEMIPSSNPNVISFPDSSGTVITTGNIQSYCLVPHTGQYHVHAHSLRVSVKEAAVLGSFTDGDLASLSNSSGSFVFLDSPSASSPNVKQDSFWARARGGFRMVSDVRSSGWEIGAQLFPKSSSWSTLSDARSKWNRTQVSTDRVLKTLVERVPVFTWRYEGQSALHMGPMAQDVHQAFALGSHEDRIPTGDMDGIMLAAAQSAFEQGARLAKEIDELEEEVEEAEARLARTQQVCEANEKLIERNEKLLWEMERSLLDV